MKAYITLLLICLCLAGQGQDKGFVLIGRIIGPISAKKILFAQYDTGHMDSTTLNDNQFTFIGKMTHPALATIWTDSLRQGFGVWLSNDTIRATFKVIYGSLQTIEVAGPAETRDCLANIKQINILNTSSLSKPQKNQQVADFIGQYVRDHPNSYYSLFLLIAHSRTLGISQTKELVASLSPSLQNSSEGDGLKADLINQETTAINKVINSFSLPDTNGILRPVLPPKKPYTLLAFWASWCAPCRSSNRKLVELYQKIDHNRVELISISLDNNRESWLKAIAKDGLKWEQLSDLNYLSGPVAKQLALYSVPQYLLVDKSSKIVASGLQDIIKVIDTR